MLTYVNGRLDQGRTSYLESFFLSRRERHGIEEGLVKGVKMG